MCVCVCVCVCVSHLLIHSSVDGHLCCFHVLAASAAMNIGVHVSFQIRLFSRYMPRSGITGSYGIQLIKQGGHWMEVVQILQQPSNQI